jgi:hypothetical protein
MLHAAMRLGAHAPIGFIETKSKSMAFECKDCRQDEQRGR